MHTAPHKENSRQDRQVAHYQSSHHVTHAWHQLDTRTCIFMRAVCKHKHSVANKSDPRSCSVSTLTQAKWEHAGLSRGDIIKRPLTERTGQRYTSFRWLAPRVCPLHTTAFRAQVFSTSSLECINIFSQACRWGFCLISMSRLNVAV